jgi:dihydroorotate dehydrogenase (fumarate)
MEPEFLRQAIANGAGAVVFPSIFQEQIEGRDSDTPQPLSANTVQQAQYNGGPELYLARLQEIKRLVSVPVIGSLHGYEGGNWLDFAKQIEAAGADALELNIQPVLAHPEQTSEELETLLCETVRSVCESVALPVAVKLTQYFTNVASMARRLQSAGAAGLVLFAHEAKWNVAIERLHWTTDWELTPVDSVAATVAGMLRARVNDLDLSIAASGGIRAAEDAIKAMIAGADVVMVTSEIYRAGPEAIRKIVDGLSRYLESGGFDSLAQFQQSRPLPEMRSQRMTRQDNIASLTRSAQYRDPTPVIEPQTGDRYGHPH